jgi:hypothetical protein
MIHVTIPSQPIPAQLLARLATARKAVDEAQPADLEKLLDAHENVRVEIVKFVEVVGTTTIPVPRERQDDVEAFIAEQTAALHALPDAPAAEQLDISAQEA